MVMVSARIASGLIELIASGPSRSCCLRPPSKLVGFARANAVAVLIALKPLRDSLIEGSARRLYYVTVTYWRSSAPRWGRSATAAEAGVGADNQQRAKRHCDVFH